MRAWVILALAACQSDGKKEALQLSNDLAVDALARIDVAMANGNPVSGLFDCVATAGADTLLEAGGEYAERARTLTKLCDRDIPIAAIRRGVEAAEAARAKSKTDKFLTACVVNDAKLAVKFLKNRDDAKDLLARFAVACPDETLDFE